MLTDRTFDDADIGQPLPREGDETIARIAKQGPTSESRDEQSVVRQKAHLMWHKMLTHQICMGSGPPAFNESYNEKQAAHAPPLPVTGVDFHHACATGWVHMKHRPKENLQWMQSYSKLCW